MVRFLLHTVVTSLLTGETILISVDPSLLPSLDRPLPCWREGKAHICWLGTEYAAIEKQTGDRVCRPCSLSNPSLTPSGSLGLHRILAVEA
ncbi:uncharacterized protein EV420DRAFT_882212 [Desarmillaria tabescens]|uniref:Secreted protein n=1 Tax=Armillaria tabescens TaxID=1929756 RepID=A0AA39MV40_ARMTA|nr:uncharacterized protein EV420DRAFT_882212 [Desarmillaria tabescens]KAK0446945.1 hypothetical protein EV420DRAFT_882212 [Desarmillaria tabescens]